MSASAQPSLFDPPAARAMASMSYPSIAAAARRGVELRPYQVEAVASINKQLGREDVRSALIVMATGTGKTTVFADVIGSTPGKCLVLAHRDELIRQAADRIRMQTGRRVTIEKAAEYASHGADVVVASVQTLMREDRLQRFGPKEFSLVVADEAHHYVAPSFRKPLDYFVSAKILGVTATPDRKDERALGAVFDEVAYVYDIEDGIRDGYLCPIRCVTVQCQDLDLSQVKTVAGDLNQGDLDAVMSTEAVLHQVVKPTLELAGERRTLVFTTSVENAHRMAEVFNRYRPESAMAVDGGTEPAARRRILADHQAGRYQYLCNVGVLTEGYDDPAVSCVAMARPTKSRALYAQMAGRGTRIAPGKEDLLILDFAGNAGKHALVTAADILGGRFPEDVVERARKKLADAGGDVRAALTAAEAEINEQKAAEARRRASAKVSSVPYHAREINPFKIFEIADPSERWGGRFGDAPPTEKQLQALTKWKIPVAGMTRRQASRLIGEQVRRFGAGLCTYGQAKFLQQRGHDTRRMLRTTAGRLMDVYKANNWRPTREQIEAATAREPGGDDL